MIPTSIQAHWPAGGADGATWSARAGPQTRRREARAEGGWL